MKVKFSDLPLGARFRMTNESERVYVLLQNYGDGLIAHYESNPYHSAMQGLFSFVDDEHSLNSQVIFIS